MTRAKERYLVDENGKRTAVVLPLKEYEQLLEDLDDLAAIAATKGEPTSSWEDVKRRLIADGILSG
jgi:hypothetical protein